MDGRAIARGLHSQCSINSMVVQKPLLSALRATVSRDRLDAYTRRTADTDLDRLGRYFWNMALCEALYPSLQCLEVALRNSFYDAATSAFGNDDWLMKYPHTLDPREYREVSAAVDRLLRRKNSTTSGRITAELNFGFWTALFDKRYEQQPNRAAPVFWPQLLSHVLPNLGQYAPKSVRTRHGCSTRLNSIRRLRNRVFHHEPIWHWTDLHRQHEELVETIGWIDQAMHDVVVVVDRFPRIHQGGPSEYRAQIDQLAQTWTS